MTTGATLYYDKLVKNDGPALFFRLCESVGSTPLNYSQFPITGSPTAITLGITGPPLLRNSDGQNTAASFNGTSSQILLSNLNSIPSNPFNTGDVFSVELWFANGTQSGAIDMFAGTNALTFAMVLSGTQQLKATRAGSSVGQFEIISDSNWHHFVWTKNGASNLFYLDGVVDTPVGGSNLTISSPTQISIGSAGASAFFLGKLCNLAWYPYPLSGGQVKNHYNASQSPFVEDLGSYPVTPNLSAQAAINPLTVNVNPLIGVDVADESTDDDGNNAPAFGFNNMNSTRLETIVNTDDSHVDTDNMTMDDEDEEDDI